MASESVTILIDAENQASAELKKVGQDLEGMSRRVKDVGQKTKASVEIAGTLANAFGGSAFGAFASQMAQVTERVSAFSEVAKTGTLGAMAFRVALAGAVGVAAFKIGNAIGNWAFETEKFKTQLKAAGTEAERLQGLLEKRQQKAFGEAREDISLVRDPGEREAATQARIDQLKKEADGLDVRINMAREEVAKRKKNESWYPIEGNWTEERKIAEQQLAQLLKNKDVLNAERETIADTISERAKSVEARKAENALAERSDSFLKSLREEVELLKATKEERLAIEAARNATPEQQGIAKALLEEREALKAKAELQKKAEQEAELAARKEQDAIERVAALEKKRLVDIEARRIELVKGREAAQAYRLEQDGLTKATAERLAAAEEQQKRLEESANKQKNLDADTSPQQAVQGRLLTKGTGGDPMMQMVNTLKAILGVGQANQKTNEEISRELRNRGFTVKTAVIP